MQNKAEFIRHATMHIGAGDWQGSCAQAVEYAERLYKALADKGYGFPEATTSPPGPRAGSKHHRGSPNENTNIP